MTPYEELILRLIIKHPGITKSTLCKMQNGPQMKVRDALQALKAGGHITGTDRQGRQGTMTTWEAV